MASSSFDRELAVYEAKLAEQSERYDDMAEAMINVAKMVGKMREDEMNLLSVACKKAIGPRRASFRKLSSMALQPSSDMAKTDLILEYRKNVESEMSDICTHILSIIDEYLIPSCEPDKDLISCVFYFKMKGDYYRYLAEFKTGTDRKEAGDESSKAYEEATKISRAQLPTTHPNRLGLALNYSVFHYEINFSPERAMEIAKEAFEEGWSALGSLNEEEFKGSTKILQLLKENNMLWDAEISGNENSLDSTVASI
ncbi:hypothetical protein ACS0TY_017333 [Phlomoides rotata]